MHEAGVMEGDEFAISVVADLLEERTGQKLTSNRRWRIGTALAGLFREHGIQSIEQLVVQLTQPGQAGLAQEVVEALLNNETYFFRDRAMFADSRLRFCRTPHLGVEARLSVRGR